MIAKKKLVFIAFNIIFIIMLGNIVFNITQTYTEIKQVKIDEKAMRKEIEELKAVKEARLKELGELDKDSTIEKLARNKLNMRKKGEVIYRFMDENQSAMP